MERNIRPLQSDVRNVKLRAGVALNPQKDLSKQKRSLELYKESRFPRCTDIGPKHKKANEPGIAGDQFNVVLNQVKYHMMSG